MRIRLFLTVSISLSFFLGNSQEIFEAGYFIDLEGSNHQERIMEGES